MADNSALALACVARHWAVFPTNADKKPITPNGFKDATLDPEKVRQWWKQRPGALIGIACPPSGFFAVDLDRKNGTDGIAAFEELAAAHGGIEYGPAQVTPSGGMHLIFDWPDSLEVNQSASKIAPGIDVRSAGYICTGSLPDGRAYVWDSAEGHGMDAPIKDAPAWLLDLVTVKAEEPKAAPSPITAPRGDINYWLDKLLPRAIPGRRNDIGLDIACQTRDAGYSQTECEALPFPERCPHGNEPYTRGEWLATVKSVYDRTPRAPARNLSRITPQLPEYHNVNLDDAPMPEPPPALQEALSASEWVDPWAKSWRTLADAFTPRPPQEWLVEDLIKLPSLNAFYGSPGDLKSMLLQDLTICGAAGFPFLMGAPWQPGGRTFAVNSYPVIWLDFDNGEEMTHERFEALARAREIDPALPTLHYVSMPSPWLILGKPESIGHLARQIKSFGARAVFIDNLGTTKGGAKENTDEMIPVMSNLRQLVNETKAAITFIHHETKNGALTARRGDSLRGHSSIEAAVDLALLVEREPGSDMVTVQSTKTRGVDVAPFSAAWTYTHKAGTTELETAMFYGLPCENKKSPQAIEAAIRETLADGPMLKTKLAKEVHAKTEGIGLNRIRDYIERMINTEAILPTPGGKTTGELCALR